MRTDPNGDKRGRTGECRNGAQRHRGFSPPEHCRRWRCRGNGVLLRRLDIGGACAGRRSGPTRRGLDYPRLDIAHGSRARTLDRAAAIRRCHVEATWRRFAITACGRRQGRRNRCARVRTGRPGCGPAGAAFADEQLVVRRRSRKEPVRGRGDVVGLIEVPGRGIAMDRAQDDRAQIRFRREKSGIDPRRHRRFGKRPAAGLGTELWLFHHCLQVEFEKRTLYARELRHLARHGQIRRTPAGPHRRARAEIMEASRHPGA